MRDVAALSAIVGAYSLPDGRQFWLDEAAATEILRRLAETKRFIDAPSFPSVLALMDKALSEHPWWKERVVGTPLENDLPVRAAVCALSLRGGTI